MSGTRYRMYLNSLEGFSLPHLYSGHLHNSEVQPHAELHDACSASGIELADVSTIHPGFQPAQVCLVERVRHLGFQLAADVFREEEALRDRRIDIPPAGTPYSMTADAARADGRSAHTTNWHERKDRPVQTAKRLLEI